MKSTNEDVKVDNVFFEKPRIISMLITRKIHINLFYIYNLCIMKQIYAF